VSSTAPQAGETDQLETTQSIQSLVSSHASQEPQAKKSPSVLSVETAFQPTPSEASQRTKPAKNHFPDATAISHVKRQNVCTGTYAYVRFWLILSRCTGFQMWAGLPGRAATGLGRFAKAGTRNCYPWAWLAWQTRIITWSPSLPMLKTQLLDSNKLRISQQCCV
jgi:hypothetical protein